MSGAPAFEFVPRQPPAALAGLVNRLWFLRGPAPSRQEKVLPMPFVHLIVNLGEPYRVLNRGGQTVDRALAGPFVSGIQSTWLLNENPAELHHVGAEFSPAGWRALAAGAAGPDVVEAEALLPGIAALADAHAHADAARALDVLEAFLVARPRAAIPALVTDTVAAIDAEPGVRMTDVARDHGVHPHHLTAVFRSHVGVPPKRYADVVRHYRFLRAIPDAPPFPRWADLVAASSYYDQPHFNKSFAAATGMTPQEYLASKQASGDPHFLPA